jgi:hypothetical protein
MAHFKHARKPSARFETTQGKGSQAEGGLRKATLLRWLRRWRQRDDQHLFEAAAPLPVDPIDELSRIVNEAQSARLRATAGHMLQRWAIVPRLIDTAGLDRR